MNKEPIKIATISSVTYGLVTDTIILQSIKSIVTQGSLSVIIRWVYLLSVLVCKNGIPTLSNAR